MGEFPALPFERILKKAGAKRVSIGACKEFAMIMEYRIMRIAEEAAALADHAGRKTVLADDVRMARRRLNL
jgi:histone H3/H4